MNPFFDRLSLFLARSMTRREFIPLVLLFCLAWLAFNLTAWRFDPWPFLGLTVLTNVLSTIQASAVAHKDDTEEDAVMARLDALEAKIDLLLKGREPSA